MNERGVVNPSPGLFVAAAMLFVGIAKMPYAYYDLMRWVVVIACGYATWWCQRNNRVSWFWTFLTVVVVFNPFAHFVLDRQRWVPLDFLGGLIAYAGAFWLLTPEIAISTDAASEASQPDWIGILYVLNLLLAADVIFSSFDLCGHWALLALVPAIPVLFIWGLALPSSFLRPRQGKTSIESLREEINGVKQLWNLAPRALMLCAVLMSLNVLSLSERYSYSTDSTGATIRHDRLLGGTVTVDCSDNDEGEGEDRQ
jgi:hypothetical protein